jgi:hypothetical protein
MELSWSMTRQAFASALVVLPQSGDAIAKLAPSKFLVGWLA